MNFKEILNCLIEREEHIQAELAKSEDSETPEETLFHRPYVLKKKTDERGNVYFIVREMRPFIELPLVLTPEQMKAYIGYENPKWNKEVEKMIRENPPNKPLHEILHTWFMKQPIQITDRLLTNLTEIDNEYLSKRDIQDDPFDIYIPQDIFYGDSWYEMICHRFMESSELHYELYELIEYGGGGKLLSRFDYFIVLFREELGVRSLKEIESLESAICYLIYRKDWIHNYQKKNKNAFSIWGDYEGYLEYIEENPNHSTFEFFASRNGFKGELWGSYEEFIHDEWLDDEFLETFNDSFEFYAKLYRDLRNAAFRKK